LTSRECKNNCKTHPYSVVIGDDTRNGKKVAIKKNKKVYSHSIEYTKRILRELKILKHISDSDHPNVLSLLDIGPINKDFDELYEVFEAMDADLSLIISQKDPCSDETIQYFVREMLKGLKFLHTGDILHRDLKPQNILVKEDGSVKICDFGLSRGVDENKVNQELTKLVQTRWYRAPEQCLGWPQARFSIDVWSIGCIFAELLRPKGKKQRNYALFPADNEAMQIIEILRVLGTPSVKELRGGQKDIDGIIESWYSVGGDKQYPPMDLNDLFPHCSKDAIHLLKRMLEINPEKRITIDEALQHPYLVEGYQDDNLTCPVFSYDWETNLVYKSGDKQGKLKVQQFQYDTLYADIMDWCKTKHNMVGDGEYVLRLSHF
jgi:serine/threonine protein kinase